MSRIGSSAIKVPDGVQVELSGQELKAKGKMGELSLMFCSEVLPKIDGESILLKPLEDTKKCRQLWGTFRSLADNLVQGVNEGFTRELDINGVGYRASVQGKKLNLQLGYSHDVIFDIPDGVKIECPSQTEIIITAADKQLLGSVAAKIRSFRPPEPYKGKGVKYRDDLIVRKEGKKK